jgi:hypothetical protein
MATSTALLVWIRSAQQANWQKPLFFAVNASGMSLPLSLSEICFSETNEAVLGLMPSPK